VAGLSKEDKGYVLNQAAFRLRAVGRLAEAVEPMKNALEVELSLKNLRRAAINANHLSEFYLPLGDLPRALEYAQQALDLADCSGDDFMRMVTRTTLSDALHQTGSLDAAETSFLEAEAIQREREPEHPLAYAVWGSRYCDLLLSRREWRKVQERVEMTLKVVQQLNWHSDIGLDYLSLGKACILQAQELDTGFTQAEGHLNLAVNCLRQAGTQHHLPRSLIARAELYCLTVDLSQAQADLEEALSIAIRGGMRLFEADCYLGFARLHLATGDEGKTCDSLARAWEIIQEIGYRRREEQVAELARGAGCTPWPPQPSR
jgi:tetratricopeptide (TPR) repeat protein